MQESLNTLWISGHAIDRMVSEANKMYPLETGGILVGYSTMTGVKVITQIIGPGPNASHSKTGFTPDPEYQSDQLGLAYESSGRTCSYLGDWHTHPDTAAYISSQDRRTLRNIADWEPARVPDPLMLVLAGRPSTWVCAGWKLVRLKTFNFKRIIPTGIKTYSSA